MGVPTMSDDAFPFETGDLVLVRIREEGRLTAKFIASCERIEQPDFVGGSKEATLSVEWGSVVSSVLYFKPHDAEFEKIESKDEVTF